MEITEYRHTDGYRRWEFSYEGIRLVLLNEAAPKHYRAELLAFKDLKLLWRIPPHGEVEHDYIVNVWFNDNKFYAGSFLGADINFNYLTGDILGTKFTK